MVFIKKYTIAFTQFFVASILYCIHRFCLNYSNYRLSFFRGFFPDYLALIVCIPIFASSQKILRLRKANRIYFIEIIGYTVLFSIYFEFIGVKLVKTFTKDFLDIFAYFLGGITLYLSQYIKNQRIIKLLLN